MGSRDHTKLTGDCLTVKTKENVRAYKRKYYVKNRKRILKEKREYYLANRQNILAKCKAYHAKNAGARQQYQTEYRKKFGKKINEKLKRKRRNNPALGMLKHAKYSARKKGIPFNLTLKDIEVPKVCPVFGFRLSVGNAIRNSKSPSLDRVNPRKGYVKGNVRVISWRANDLKKNATLKEVKALLKYLETLSGD